MDHAREAMLREQRGERLAIGEIHSAMSTSGHSAATRSRLSCGS
jgi:hypothetical protein